MPLESFGSLKASRSSAIVSILTDGYKRPVAMLEITKIIVEKDQSIRGVTKSGCVATRQAPKRTAHATIPSR